MTLRMAAVRPEASRSAATESWAARAPVSDTASSVRRLSSVFLMSSQKTPALSTMVASVSKASASAISTQSPERERDTAARPPGGSGTGGRRGPGPGGRPSVAAAGGGGGPGAPSAPEGGRQYWRQTPVTTPWIAASRLRST